MRRKQDKQDRVVVELDVDQFGPFDNPSWVSGVFVVSPAQAEVLKNHFTHLAASYGEQRVMRSPSGALTPVARYQDRLGVNVRPILPIPLEVYDVFISILEIEGVTVHVVLQRYENGFLVITNGDRAFYPTLKHVRAAAEDGTVRVYPRITDARNYARELDSEGELNWEKGTLRTLQEEALCA